MKKKKKQRVIIIATVLAFIFPIIVKAMNLNSNQITACISFYGLVVSLYSNFEYGEALQVKLSIIA